MKKTILIGKVDQFWLYYFTGIDGYPHCTNGANRVYDETVTIKPYGNQIRVSIPFYWQDNAGEDHKSEMKHYYVSPDSVSVERHVYYGGGGYNYRITMYGEKDKVVFMNSARFGEMPNFRNIAAEGYKPKKKSEMEPGFRYGCYVKDVNDGVKSYYTNFLPDENAAAWLINLYNQYAKPEELIS